jgi:hypothetical protein
MISAWLLLLSLVFVFLGYVLLFWPSLLGSAFLALNRAIPKREVVLRPRPFLGIALLSFGLALCLYASVATFTAKNARRSESSSTASVSNPVGQPTGKIALWGGAAICLLIAAGAVRLLIDPDYMYKLRDSLIYYRDKWDETRWARRNARIVGGVVLLMSLWFLYRIVFSP